MKFIFPPSDSEQGKLQSLLMRFAALFLLLVSVAVTLTPAVRLHSWKADYRYFHWIGFFVWFAAFSWIHHQSIHKLENMDPYILPVTSLLGGWGLISIWRLSTPFGLRQSIWMLLGVVLTWLVIRFPIILAYLRRYKYIWLVGGLILTGLTFIIGSYPGGIGPNLWLNFGGIYLQPSEPLKLLLIVYLAAYFADQSAVKLRRLQLLTPTFILVAAAVILLLAQRDLGTALVFLLLYFAIAFIATGDRWIIITAGFLVIAAGILGYRLYPVIQERVSTWMNPWLDPMGSSYQIIQSLIAVASGGIFGRGPGLGNPGLVPISHSDFIFTAISEEFGLIGTVGIILLFILLTFRAFKISMNAPNQYRRYLAAGLGIYFSLQAMLIIAGNLNLFPLSGITLPFVSYGGSSLLVSFLAVALLIVIGSQMETENQVAADARPYRLLGSLVLYSWLLIALTNGYWIMFRGEELTSRSDNLRLAINDFYVPRGNFVDRNNQPITQTNGERGDFSTFLLDPQLSSVIGFSSLVYGQAGLEASLDSYLRGLQGDPASMIWYHSLFYSQRPPGLDVRLSLDLQLQTIADQLMQDVSGAIVLMNAQTGEILVMSSAPTFDANQLDENLRAWQTDEESPFINRATQGQYYPETAFAPFILYKVIEKDSFPEIPQQLSVEIEGQVISCAKAPDNVTEWREVISNGCPGAILALIDTLTAEDLISLYTDLGFYQTPSLLLPVSEPDSEQPVTEPLEFYENNIYITPLQMVMAASAISADGSLPDPTLVLAVETPHQGWVILSQGSSQQVLDNNLASDVIDMLSMPSNVLWKTLGYGNGSDGEESTWFIGGTTSEWQGSPLAIAVVLESRAPDLAEQIGLSLLEATIHPAGN